MRESSRLQCSGKSNTCSRSCNWIRLPSRLLRLSARRLPARFASLFGSKIPSAHFIDSRNTAVDTASGSASLCMRCIAPGRFSCWLPCSIASSTAAASSCASRSCVPLGCPVAESRCRREWPTPIGVGGCAAVNSKRRASCSSVSRGSVTILLYCRVHLCGLCAETAALEAAQPKMSL